MPRHHTLWDSTLGRQVNVPFTAEEEIARDAEEAAWLIKRAIRDERKELIAGLEIKLNDDSITFDELKELLRLRG